MSDVTITLLPAYTTPTASDVIPIVDIGSNITKKIAFSDLVPAAPAGSNGDVQMKSGTALAASHLNDNGVQVGSTEPFEFRFTTNNFTRFTQATANSLQWTATLHPPTAPSAVLVVDGSGNATAGTHSFKVTYVTAGGETLASTASNTVTCDGTHTKVTLTIPTGTSNLLGLNNIATGRNIYATKAGGTTYFLIATSPVVADNTTTTYTFNIADGSFTATVEPTSNTAIDTRLFMDNLGNFGIGTTSPVFVDDIQAKTFAVYGGTNGYSYIAAGTSSTGVNARAGGFMFYNLAMGGVDHRTAAILSDNDGALGTGTLAFYTTPNNVGPLQRMIISSGGDVAIGLNVSGATSTVRLQVASADATSATYAQSWEDGNGNALGSIRGDGRFTIGSAVPQSAFNVGTTADPQFQVNINGKFATYGGDPAKGDIIAYNSTTGFFERLPVGTNGQVLTADSTQNIGVKWA